MKVRNPETGTYVVTSCTGCMCHEMAMVFGADPNRCAECGCPKTLKGWTEANRCPSCGEQMVNGRCEDCDNSAERRAPRSCSACGGQGRAEDAA